ncbi:MAG: amidohydrolase [Candidatus Delongbacteria bacterium]|nr:amidohydrolase [Candidatus Delongbacteria bacterium]MBN2835600.1 amidohydrolase [Candidatus Delongbacteria bacterium]
MLDKLVELRQELHAFPEISGSEMKTSLRIMKFFSQLEYDDLVEFPNYGLAYIFNGKSEGKTIMFRADMDAVSVYETNDFDHCSRNEGCSHSCGHDGHMTILAGLGEVISKNRDFSGKVILLFQPSEENGQGASELLRFGNFRDLKPDYIFGLHNVPGYPKGAIISKKEVFSNSSTGATIFFVGKDSHAAEPEKGINPIYTMMDIVKVIKGYCESDKIEKNSKITMVGINSGGSNFGISPGKGVLHMTLRAESEHNMNRLKMALNETVDFFCKRDGVISKLDYSETFPSIENSDECFNIIKSASDNFIEVARPFKWSEDFGWYTRYYNCGFFGLASGEEQPVLHSSNFDFPDDIIEVGIKTYLKIISKISGLDGFKKELI